MATELNLSELKKKAEAATPGKWHFNSYNIVYSPALSNPDDDDDYVCRVPTIAGDTATAQGYDDAQFIAACDPTTILALIARVEELELPLKMLYEENADYITRNNLGDVHHNQSMKLARAALAGRK